jgi:hypothetical protein
MRDNRASYPDLGTSLLDEKWDLGGRPPALGCRIFDSRGSASIIAMKPKPTIEVELCVEPRPQTNLLCRRLDPLTCRLPLQ